MNQAFLAAALQFNPIWHEFDKNVERLYAMAEQAAQAGAKLIVTPEMALTGYHFQDRAEVSQYTVVVPGALTDLFGRLARQYGCYLVLGLPEVDRNTGLYYNSAVLVGPQGYIGKYRKTHLWENEMHWAVWGNLGIPMFATKIGRLAMIICMDAYFFETFRLAALQDADIVAFLTNSSGGALANLQTRAAENGLYVVSANRSDQEFEHAMKGASAIWDPSGRLLTEGSTKGEEIVRALIDPGAFRHRRRQLLDRRRPELYRDLALHIAPWNQRKNDISHDLVAAVCQYEPVLDSPQVSMETVTRLMAQAEQQVQSVKRKLDLIVLPELSFCGPPALVDRELADHLAEPVEDEASWGKNMVFASELAESYQANVVFGLVEVQDDRFYNTAVFLGRDGKVLAKYRKTHLSLADSAWATAGQDFQVVEVDGLGKVGLAIGCDSEFPEVATILAVKRADLVVMPSAWAGEQPSLIGVSPEVHPYSGRGMIYWDSRARDNCFYLAVANYVGGSPGYQGLSGIYGIDPIYGLDQHMLLTSGEEGVLVTKVQTRPEHWYNQDNFMACRRADQTYYPLLLPG